MTTPLHQARAYRLSESGQRLAREAADERRARQVAGFPSVARRATGSSPRTFTHARTLLARATGRPVVRIGPDDLRVRLHDAFRREPVLRGHDHCRLVIPWDGWRGAREWRMGGVEADWLLEFTETDGQGRPFTLYFRYRTEAEP